MAGMRTLLEDGVEKAARGLTTRDEVRRVASHDNSIDRDDGVDRDNSLHRDDGVDRDNGLDRDAAISSAAAPAEDLAGFDFVALPAQVLVVEDSDTIVAVVKYFLELEGFRVLVAADGLAGLEMAQREQPDVIVSDLNMPGMGGLQMVKALRSDPRTMQTRIIMLTSDSSVDSEIETLAAGADDYIVKPVEPRRLAWRVKALLAR